ncbi:hypothetical protein [Aliiroseovarius sp. F20344]|uniref:hypothetical protein n=1 Tax=Aliiroseovarius sp. F20344 TaxID=2926414 RepID=UPI001FF6181E|nr:hypothetical protein [Aliiroseovarius sp. F20344]MCK0141184.1 hypothetical protein [Aliiroseovarius sp. F20344]
MTLRITIACPEELIGDANQFALCVGSSAADAQTFSQAIWEIKQGDRFALASLLAGDSFPVAASQPLKAPHHAPDMDLAAATQAQMKLEVWSPTVSNTPPALNKTTILAVVGIEPKFALPLLDLSPIPIEI